MTHLIISFLILYLASMHCCAFSIFPANNNKVTRTIWNLLNDNNTLKPAISLSIENDIDKLISSYRPSSKFITGCFESVPYGNNKPNWKQYSDIITKLTNNNSNKNYQIFNSNSSFLNLSEYNGENMFATASGTYSKLDNSSTPKFLATVTEISIYLHFLNQYRKFSFNVNGNGIINIIYQDSEFRIIQNEQQARAFQRKVTIPICYKKLLSL